jgi:hypothetical protein
MIVGHPAGSGGRERDPETVAVFLAAAPGDGAPAITGLVRRGSRVAGAWDRTPIMALWTSAGTPGVLLELRFQLRLVLFDEGANLVRHGQELRPLFFI